jgi:hypothetical protein
MAGRFSSDAGDPYRVDATALLRWTRTALAAIFQAGADNPLVGLAGRTALLRQLGMALRDQPQTFTSIGQPGHLFDALTYHAHAPKLRHHRPAPGRSGITTSARRASWARCSTRSAASGQRAVAGRRAARRRVAPSAGRRPGRQRGLVPFHKLSQWLAYSLIEPFQWAGVQVMELDALTALPEYRNGGLLLDAGVLVPREPAHLAQPLRPQDPWVVEWRALTVALVDELAPLVRPSSA